MHTVVSVKIFLVECRRLDRLKYNTVHAFGGVVDNLNLGFSPFFDNCVDS